jgi:hypothetical protein
MSPKCRSRKHVRDGGIHGSVVAVVLAQHLHTLGAYNLGEPMRVRDVLHLRPNDLSRLVEQPVPVPSGVECAKLGYQAVVLPKPHGVQGEQAKLKYGRNLD